MKKLLCVLVSLLMVMSLLVSCGSKAKDFSWQGLTLTLDSSFTTVDTTDESASYANYFKMYVVIITRETFAELSEVEIDTDMTVEEYAKLSIEANEFDATVQTEDGVTYYTYTADVDGTEFTYMATVHRLGEAYWLVQFASETADFETAKPQFITWAKTVTYNAEA